MPRIVCLNTSAYTPVCVCVCNCAYTTGSKSTDLLEGGGPRVSDAPCSLERRGQLWMALRALRSSVRVSTLCQDQLREEREVGEKERSLKKKQNRHIQF